MPALLRGALALFRRIKADASLLERAIESLAGNCANTGEYCSALPPLIIFFVFVCRFGENIGFSSLQHLSPSLFFSCLCGDPGRWKEAESLLNELIEISKAAKGGDRCCCCASF